MIRELSGRIESELAELNLPKTLPGLYDPITYTLENGGKRLRPLLLMIAARIFDVPDDKSIHQAMGVEIFHNFTLVHDDIMDNAPLRRGKPSVFKKWDENTAILSGDVMFSISMQQVSMCDSHVLPRVMESFLDTTIKVCEGQQMDMDFEERGHVEMEEYIEMIGLKTAYLLAGSLKIGALLSNASDEIANAMFAYGMKAGTAFQLIDDYLDAFGDPEKFGKQVGGDILEAKKTYLYIETLNCLQGEEKSDFKKIFNDTTLAEEDKVDRVKEYFVQCGAQDKIRELANKLLFESKQILDGIEGNEEAKEELINLTLQLTNREK